MTGTGITREIQDDGSVVLRDGRCRFAFKRIGRGVMELTIAGIDNGQLGTAPLDELSLALVRERPLELFIDATEASMPAVGVSREWTRFFALNQKDFKRVSVLVGSKSVELTIAIAKHLSETGKLIQIYSDEQLYESRRAAAL